MLNVEMMNIDAVQPYGRNAKEHPQEQIDAIAESIREFGMNDPIAVCNGVIVEGHGRYLALKQMGWQEIPVIRLDHLTEEQRKAYTLAHNKLTLNTGFDIDLLNAELADLSLDMTKFDFQMPDFSIGEASSDEEEDEEVSYDYGTYDEAEQTDRKMNIADFDASRSCGFYQIPTLKACGHVPTGLLSFDRMTTRSGKKRKEDGIHFFVHDSRFEKLWRNPMRFIPDIAEYDCVLTPDFSVYVDMPMAMKIWNVYRSRLIGQMMQDYGLKVIPTLTWAEPSTYDFCFDGIEQGGTVAVSTVGVMRNNEAKPIWIAGMNEAVKRIRPEKILVYGHKRLPDFDAMGAEIIRFEAYKFDKEAMEWEEEDTSRENTRTENLSE